VFKEAAAGLGDACKVFDTPVTGGNVSFYNENPKSSVYPTPTIGMLGLMTDFENQKISADFKKSGDEIFYIGADRNGLGGSEYLSWVLGKVTGDAPYLDLEFEAKLQKALLDAIWSGKINAAHDISDGGLAVSLAEMAIFGNIGCSVSLSNLKGETVDKLYSEAQSGVIITVQADQADETESFFKSLDVPVYSLGKVGGDSLNIEGSVNISVQEMSNIYNSAIPAIMNKTVSVEE
jgi:phosphoribosylformylglycinamidine synthase